MFRFLQPRIVGIALKRSRRLLEKITRRKDLLIRLESKKGGIGVMLYDERELTIATRERIEVR